MADAQKAGLVKDKGGWDKYPANMLRWRAVGYCADIVFPDIVGGLSRPEELGAVVNSEGEPLPAPPAVTIVQPEPPANLTVADILNAGFSAEQIVVANEGRIPATSEECAAVLAKLQGA